MQTLDKYTSEVDMTYFKKVKKVFIDDVPVGSLVYLKVDSHLKTNIREVEFYGKILKITPCFFEFLSYFEALWRLDNWSTDEIKKKENNPAKYTKKCAKKSIIEIWLVDIEQKKEIKEYYKNT